MRLKSELSNAKKTEITQHAATVVAVSKQKHAPAGTDSIERLNCAQGSNFGFVFG